MLQDAGGAFHLSDVAIVFATLMGPILAVQAQRWIDVHRERRKAKENIFRTLMATRAAFLSADHVRALNMIELEFGKGKREKPIIEAWRAFHAHLGTKMADDEAWRNRRVDRLVDMLYEMAKYLKYDFDKTQIRTSWYAPVAHGTIEEENATIRASIIKVLKGEAPLVVTAEPPKPPTMLTTRPLRSYDPLRLPGWPSPYRWC